MKSIAFRIGSGKGTPMRSKLLILILAVSTAMLFVWNLQLQAQASGADMLRNLEAEFERATTERGLDGFMSYFNDDSADLPSGSNIVFGKDNIRKELEPWGPDVSLTWKPVKAEMAASGDLGYTFGNFVFKAKDKDGKLVSHYGKYATVWKKQPNGSWKVAFDMGNRAPHLSRSFTTKDAKVSLE
jgi:ketosteroid isomerase-like protein